MAEIEVGRLPTDSDVDLHAARQRAELRRAPWGVLGAISAGGGIGALARYAVGHAFPASPGGVPWATFTINVVGCLLIGVLMVLVTEVWGGRRLLRPFLGVGVLGGFTTFSTSMVDTQRLVDTGSAAIALAYLVGTVLAALIAAHAGITATRVVVGRRGKRKTQ